MEELITPITKDKSLRILDACCGIGHILYFLAKRNPNSTFLGVDKAPYLIEEANKLCKDKRNVYFKVGDVYGLPSRYYKEFDVSTNWKTISWLPYYDQILKSLMAVTQKYIFVSSLFYDGDIDFEIKVGEFKKEAGHQGFNAFYNVYSLPHFTEFVYSLGAKNVEICDFEIHVDIACPPLDQIGTHTVKLETGEEITD